MKAVFCSTRGPGVVVDTNRPRRRVTACRDKSSLESCRGVGDQGFGDRRRSTDAQAPDWKLRLIRVAG